MSGEKSGHAAECDNATSARVERVEARGAWLAGVFARPKNGLRWAGRNAIERMGRHRLAWLLLAVSLVAALLVAYMGLGALPALAHLTAFACAFAAPFALAFMWPVVAAAFVAACAWSVWMLGSGGLWLAMATASAALFFYLSAAWLAPIFGAVALGYVFAGAGAVAGWIAFAASLPLLVWARLRLTAPILAALWAWAASHLAERAAMASASDVLDWPRRGLLAWTIFAMILAGALVWPSPQKRRRRGGMQD